MSRAGQIVRAKPKLNKQANPMRKFHHNPHPAKTEVALFKAPKEEGGGGMYTMSRNEQSTNDDVPPIAKPLAPYIRSRQDALRIRQALTRYLQSHIVSTADDNDDNADSPASSHLFFTAPSNGYLSVNRVSSDVIGVRKEYLKALQEHVAVKREYDDLFDRLTSRKVVDKSVAHLKTRAVPYAATNTDAPSVLDDYLSLLRERRRDEKLQLFDIHLKELDSIAEPPQTEQHDSSSARVDLDGLLRGKGNDTTPGSDDNIQALVTKLERTVVKAKAKLVREQSLLEELRSRQAANESAGDTIKANTRIALQRTRDELVQWVEEKLAITSTEDDGISHELQYGGGTTDTADTAQLVAAEYKSQIREQYAAYVNERKSLLDAVSALSQPTKSATLASEPQAVKKLTEPPATNEVSDEWGPIDVFQAVSEQILPAAKYQKSLALQRSYLAGILTKEKSTLKHTLDRLSQESHLLPEYPILARQSKFRHITTGNGSGLRRVDREGGKQTARDDVLEHAQAWAFAANAARSNESDYIEDRIEHGAEMADTASDTLQQVYDLLHQERNANAEVADDGKDAQQESDIWTAEVQLRKARARRPNEKKQQSRGPWSVLNGQVGIDN